MRNAFNALLAVTLAVGVTTSVSAKSARPTIASPATQTDTVITGRSVAHARQGVDRSFLAAEGSDGQTETGGPAGGFSDKN